MTTYGIPYLLEDRTGDVLNTEFDELYDRMFFGVASSPSSCSSSSSSSSSSSPSAAPPSPSARTIKIFELGSRSGPSTRLSVNASSRANANANGSFGRDPAVVLDFAANALGTVLFVRQGVSMPMAHWIRRSGSAGKGGSGSGRRGCAFACSDGENYSWTHQANAETEWACTTASGYVVAQYNLCTPDEPKYASSSGNMFTVYESYGHIATELLASLTIVRYMQRYNISA